MVKLFYYFYIYLFPYLVVWVLIRCESAELLIYGVGVSDRGFFSNKKLFRNIYEAGAMVSLKNPKQFLLVLSEIGWRVISLSTLTGTKVTNRVRLLHNFGKYLILMNQRHGSLYVVKYLKACQIAVQRKVAKSPFKSLREIEPDLHLPRLSTSGLPVIIKLADRRAICVGGINTIRLYLSIFSLYRIISAPVKAKLDTITAPYSGDPNFLVSVAEWSERFVRLLPHIPRRSVSAFSLLPLLKSSPSSTVSWTGFVRDAYTIDVLGFLPIFRAYSVASGSQFLWDQLFNLSLSFKTLKGPVFEPFLSGETKAQNQAIGQLQFKEEAAGKLRIFAMVDVWTQSFLSPLHDYLGEILRSLPNDGTFDQEASFKRSLRKAETSKKAFSYDLSSATDRLPVEIQEVLLNYLFKSDLGTCWRRLLTLRNYVIPSSGSNYGISLTKVRYAVGQPMGALSSWNMLALTHHLLLQFSAALAYRKTGEWNEEYEILGDDLVIFNAEIAEQYLKVCSGLGIGINLSKSLVSVNSPVFEFAKRFGVNSSDASAVSWKQLYGQNSLRGRIAIASYFMNKGISKYPMGVFWLCIKGLPWSKSKPSNWFNKVSLISLLVSLVKQRKLSSQWLIRALMDPMNPTSSLGRIIDVVPYEHLISVLAYYFKHNRTMPPIMPAVPDKYGNYWNLLHPFYEAIAIEKLNRLFHIIDADGFSELKVSSWLDRIVPSQYRSILGPAFLSAIATVLHSMLNRYLLEADALRADIDVGYRGLDAMFSHIEKFEGVLAMLDLPKQSIERKVKISNDIEVLRFIDQAHRKHLEYILFQMRKRMFRH